jgi:membrane associated rhomboid family serine protease
MIFPIGDDQVVGGHRPIWSYSFLLLNILLFFYESVIPEYQLNSLFMQWGVIPSRIVQFQSTHTLVTSMFLHGSFMHLAGNMVFLWVFADNIEAIVGGFRFFLFYIFGGVLAMFTQVLMDVSTSVPTIGASGAVAAVLGAYLVMFPHSRIRIWAFIFFFLRWPAWVFLLIWIFQQLFNGYNSLTEVTNNVAWWAHIGGFAVGVLYGINNKSKVRRVIRDADIETSPYA